MVDLLNNTMEKKNVDSFTNAFMHRNLFITFIKN